MQRFEDFELMVQKGYMVAILCMTYNQSAYIIDALNGFSMQQTSFPFLAVVVDDASTDGEQDRIKAYLDEHFDHLEKNGFMQWETEDAYCKFAHHIENKSCHFLVVCLKKNLYGNPKKDEIIKEYIDAKYTALCEGDDYWTDPLKLQKQVDFLESHLDYTMCFHATDVVNESIRDILIHSDTIESRDYLPDDVFPEWVAHTSSFLYRTGVPEKFLMKHSEWLKAGDTVLVLKCMHLGKVRGMCDHMSVYRMNDYSVMSKTEDAEVYAKHLKCILMNFPKINKWHGAHEICDIDCDLFKRDAGKRNRWFYLFDAIRTSPLYMWILLKKKLHDVFV